MSRILRSKSRPTAGTAARTDRCWERRIADVEREKPRGESEHVDSDDRHRPGGRMGLLAVRLQGRHRAGLPAGGAHGEHRGRAESSGPRPGSHANRIPHREHRHPPGGSPSAGLPRAVLHGIEPRARRRSVPEDVTAVLNGGADASSSRFAGAAPLRTVAAGTLKHGYFLDPGEVLCESTMVFVPSDDFDALETQLRIPCRFHEAPVHVLWDVRPGTGEDQSVQLTPKLVLGEAGRERVVDPADARRREANERFGYSAVVAKVTSPLCADPGRQLWPGATGGPGASAGSRARDRGREPRS